jgi:hypothetical protein
VVDMRIIGVVENMRGVFYEFDKIRYDKLKFITIKEEKVVIARCPLWCFGQTECRNPAMTIETAENLWSATTVKGSQSPWS